MRSCPTWSSILKKLTKCALRYFRRPGVSTVITGMRSVRRAQRRPNTALASGATCVGRRHPAVRFGALPQDGPVAEPPPRPAWRAPVTAVRPLRISVRGALGCGVRL